MQRPTQHIDNLEYLYTSTMSKITQVWGSRGVADFVEPGVDNWLAIDVADEGHQAFAEFVFGGDTDVAQHRTRQFGEEALDEIEPRPMRRRECERKAADRLRGKPGFLRA